MNKLWATSNKIKPEQANFEEINNKIADEELLAIIEQGKKEYLAKEKEFRIEADEARKRYEKMIEKA